LVFFRWPSVVRPPLNGHTGGQLVMMMLQLLLLRERLGQLGVAAGVRGL